MQQAVLKHLGTDDNYNTMLNLIDDAFNHFMRMENFDFPKPEIYINGFKLKDGVYEFSMNVDKNANADNVKIDLDKNNVLKIKYSTKTSVAERIVMVSESLPDDADADTIDAKIVDGKLIVTVNKK